MDFFLFSPNQNNLEISSQVRNISWKTSISENTPFRNGDTIDLVYFLKNTVTVPQKVRYNFSDIKKTMDVENISLDDAKGSAAMIISDASGFSLDPGAEVALHITGKVKNDAEIKNNLLLLTKDSKVPFFQSNDDFSVKKTTRKANEQTPDNFLPVGTTLDSMGNVSNPTTVEHSQYNPNTDNVIVLDKPENAVVNSIIVGEKTITPIITDKKIFAYIPKDTFQASQNFVALSLDNGTLIPVEKSIDFVGKIAKISLSHIVPDVVEQ